MAELMGRGNAYNAWMFEADSACCATDRWGGYMMLSCSHMRCCHALVSTVGRDSFDRATSTYEFYIGLQHQGMELGQRVAFHATVAINPVSGSEECSSAQYLTLAILRQ